MGQDIDIKAMLTLSLFKAWSLSVKCQPHPRISCPQVRLNIPKLLHMPFTGRTSFTHVLPIIYQKTELLNWPQ